MGARKRKKLKKRAPLRDQLMDSCDDLVTVMAEPGHAGFTHHWQLWEKLSLHNLAPDRRHHPVPDNVIPPVSSRPDFLNFGVFLSSLKLKPKSGSLVNIECA